MSWRALGRLGLAVALLFTVDGLSAFPLGTSDQSFTVQANALRETWDRYQHEGVAAVSLAPLRAQLDVVAQRQYLGMPSLAPTPARYQPAIDDLHAEAGRVYWSALVESRGRAIDSRAELRAALGIAARGQQVLWKEELADAKSPADYDQLAGEWHLAAQMVPIDRHVASLLDAVLGLSANARDLNVSDAPASDSISAAQAYATMEPADRQRFAAAVLDRLDACLLVLKARVDAAARAHGSIESAAKTVGQAHLAGFDTSGYQTRLDKASHDYLAATNPADFDAVAAEAVSIAADVNRQTSGAYLPTSGGCSKLIDVNLSSQQLVASSCGSVFVSTPITSGMPGLRTPTGTFSISLKERNVYFYSPWPPGSPYYYPPMFVAYAMEFLGSAYFIHTDPNEPSGAYGAGSENGPYASHGCVHVPDAVMVGLFNWAPDGTVVRIHY